MALTIPSWFRIFRNAKAVWLMLQDTGEHWTKKSAVALALCLTILYALWPIDLIPDIIPLLGWLDDVGLIMLCHVILNQVGMKYAEKMLSRKDSCAAGSLPRPP